jgi:TPR repeat protein
VSYALALMERSAEKGNIDASANLARLYTLGVPDYNTGTFIV